MGLETVLTDIRIERLRQDAKWGSQRKLPHDTWYRILGEEFGEVAKALNEGDPDEHIYEELIQVAAVATNWSEAIHAKSEVIPRHPFGA